MKWWWSAVLAPDEQLWWNAEDFSASQLGALVVREAIARAKLDPAQVHQLVCGNVIHGETRDMYVSRAIAIDAGMAHGSPAP